ncbi:MAG TPA: SAM-dependent methyltransferase, partial [Myxococcaceae bacterium]
CEELFQGAASSSRAVHREFTFRYLSAAHFIDVFRSFYGPIHKLYGALAEEKARAFTAELTELIGRFNRSGDDTVVIPSKYLELVVHRR